MIVNKLDKSMKDTMKKRTRTALIMLLYGLGILFCLTLTDKSSDG
jgi:integral membrane sensor domain MASE1